MNDYNGKVINGHLLKLNWTNLNVKSNHPKKNNYKNEQNNYTVSIYIVYYIIDLYWEFRYKHKRR